MVNINFPIRFATDTELMAMRQRLTSLARVGAPAAELAQAALEYHYYLNLNNTHKLITEPKGHIGEPRLRFLSDVETQRAMHMVQAQSAAAMQPIKFTHTHNAAVPLSLAFQVGMRA